MLCLTIFCPNFNLECPNYKLVGKHTYFQGGSKIFFALESFFLWFIYWTLSVLKIYRYFLQNCFYEKLYPSIQIQISQVEVLFRDRVMQVF